MAHIFVETIEGESYQSSYQNLQKEQNDICCALEKWQFVERNSSFDFGDYARTAKSEPRFLNIAK